MISQYFIIISLVIRSVQSVQNDTDTNNNTLHIHNISQIQCQKYSPMTEIKYHYDSVKNVEGINFCTPFSKRTCCSPQNFDELKIKQNHLKVPHNNILIRWLKTNAAGYELLSEKCLNAYKEIICYDCDSDVGQGIRRGLCPHICEGLYQACIDDYFKFNKDKMDFCSQESFICSELNYIFDKSQDFCEALGFGFNTFKNYTQFYSEIQNQTIKQPLCFNMVPSHKIYGVASTKIFAIVPQDVEKDSLLKNKFQSNLNSKNIICVFIIILMIMIHI